MKATYFIDHIGKVILICFEGIVILDKLYDAIQFLWTIDGYNPSYDQIVDHRKASLKISVGEMADLAVFMRDSDLGLKAKAAIVISAPSDAALSEIYGYKSRDNHATEIFSSEHEAIGFTGASMDIYEGLKSEAAIQKEF